MAENKIDQVEKPAYSPNKNAPKDVEAGGMNLSSIMNIFAVMLAEGSGDPQVKQQVLQNLAQRQAAKEAEAANQQAFENEVSMMRQRAKLGIATEAQAESEVPSKMAGARKATAEADILDSTKASTIAATTATNTQVAAVTSAQNRDPEFIQGQVELPKLDLKIKNLEIKIKEAELANANDPRLKELRVEMAKYQAERAKYEAAEQRMKVQKSGGFGTGQGLNPNQQLTAINNDFSPGSYASLPMVVKQKIARGRDLAEQAPTWLQNMRFIGKYAEESKNPLTGALDPSKGEIAYVDMITAVVPVMAKITSGELPTAPEARLLQGAIEDGYSQDPYFYDNIVEELARSAQMIDPDTFGSAEPVVPGAMAAMDSTDADLPAEEISPDQVKKKNAKAWAMNLLATYGITKELMDQHKQSRQQAAYNAQTEAMMAKPGPSSKPKTKEVKSETAGHNQ